MVFNGCVGATVKLSKMIFESKNEYLQEIVKANKDFCILFDILLGESNKQYNTSNIEAIKLKKNDDQRSRINKIDTEEKLTEMNRFSAFEMFHKEISLFKLYKEGKDYTQELAKFRKEKIIIESECIKKIAKTGKTESSSNNVNIKVESDRMEKESNYDDDGNKYWDNSYWYIYPNRIKDSLS